MKINYIISAVIVIGLLVLFAFPNPETNFFAYIGTAFFFALLIVLLYIWNKKKK